MQPLQTSSLHYAEAFSLTGIKKVYIGNNAKSQAKFLDIYTCLPCLKTHQ